MRGALFNDKQGEARFYWFTVKDSPDGEWAREGRFFLRVLGKGFSFEWALFRFRGSLTLDLDEDVTLGVGMPWVGNFYLSAEGFVRKWYGRTIGIRFFDRGVWWDVWSKQNEWSSRDPKWMHGCWHPIETFLGRAKYTKEELGSEQVLIPLPEGSYAAKATRERCTWKRPRWPWGITKNYISLDLDRGAPFPGKGENSWDIDDDAIFGMSTQTANIEDAVADYVRATLRNRRRYGGSIDWQPSEASR